MLFWPVLRSPIERCFPTFRIDIVNATILLSTYDKEQKLLKRVCLRDSGINIRKKERIKVSRPTYTIVDLHILGYIYST